MSENQALTACPQCDSSLGSPLKSGRFVCRECGWTDKPKKVETVVMPSLSSIKNCLTSDQNRPALLFVIAGVVGITVICAAAQPRQSTQGRINEIRMELEQLDRVSSLRSVSYNMYSCDAKGEDIPWGWRDSAENIAKREEFCKDAIEQFEYRAELEEELYELLIR
jgi:hypothetical protein